MKKERLKAETEAVKEEMAGRKKRKRKQSTDGEGGKKVGGRGAGRGAGGAAGRGGAGGRGGGKAASGADGGGDDDTPAFKRGRKSQVGTEKEFRKPGGAKVGRCRLNQSDQS